jgi:hypothetical protein
MPSQPVPDLTCNRRIKLKGRIALSATLHALISLQSSGSAQSITGRAYRSIRGRRHHAAARPFQKNRASSTLDARQGVARYGGFWLLDLFQDEKLTRHRTDRSAG